MRPGEANGEPKELQGAREALGSGHGNFSEGLSSMVRSY
jgi:hypothetical protein